MQLINVSDKFGLFESWRWMEMQSKKQPKFFWVSAMAPLTSVIFGSILVYVTHADKHGVQVVSPDLVSLFLIIV